MKTLASLFIRLSFVLGCTCLFFSCCDCSKCPKSDPDPVVIVSTSENTISLNQLLKVGIEQKLDSLSHPLKMATMDFYRDTTNLETKTIFESLKKERELLKRDLSDLFHVVPPCPTLTCCPTFIDVSGFIGKYSVEILNSNLETIRRILPETADLGNRIHFTYPHKEIHPHPHTGGEEPHCPFIKLNNGGRTYMYNSNKKKKIPIA